MRFSEAVRAGIAKDGYQTFRVYVDRDTDNKIVGCCTLGAALIGINHLDLRDDVVQVLQDNFPDLFEREDEDYLSTRMNSCPEPNPDKPGIFCGRPQSNYSLVVHLNDDHFWTREKIADFFESRGF